MWLMGSQEGTAFASRRTREGGPPCRKSNLTRRPDPRSPLPRQLPDLLLGDGKGQVVQAQEARPDGLVASRRRPIQRFLRALDHHRTVDGAQVRERVPHGLERRHGPADDPEVRPGAGGPRPQRRRGWSATRPWRVRTGGRPRRPAPAPWRETPKSLPAVPGPGVASAAFAPPRPAPRRRRSWHGAACASGAAMVDRAPSPPLGPGTIAPPDTPRTKVAWACTPWRQAPSSPR